MSYQDELKKHPHNGVADRAATEALRAQRKPTAEVDADLASSFARSDTLSARGREFLTGAPSMYRPIGSDRSIDFYRIYFWRARNKKPRKLRSAPINYADVR
jgi:hypothetical protein